MIRSSAPRRLGPAIVAGGAAVATLTTIGVVGLGSCCSDQPDRAQSPPTSSDSPPTRRGQRFFAPDSIWNRQLPAALRPDRRSSRVVSALVEQVEAFGTAVDTERFSVPIYSVPAGQARVRVVMTTPNADLRAALARVPIPPGAVPADGNDHHLVVWQPSRDTLWEFWHTRRRRGTWYADYGGKMLNVSESPGYYRHVESPAGHVLQQPWWGATATSLPLVGGLVTFRDLRRGRIDHALAMAVPRVRKGVRVLPAQRSDGKYTDEWAIPEGAHFRLDPNLDVDGLPLPRFTRMLADAAQRYGMIVRDGGGAVAFYAEDPRPHGRNPYPREFQGLPHWQLLRDFPWEHLELVPMRLRHNAG